MKLRKIKKLLIGYISFALFFSLIILTTQGILEVGNPNAIAVMGSGANYFIDFDPNERFRAIPSGAAQPSVAAQGAVLIDAYSGNVIFELNAHKQLPMASTTKIMTAITAIESGVDLDKIVTITRNMTGAEGSSIYLHEGERFTLRDLIYALMLNSANDAGEAIAISVAGSVEDFAVMMNDKVRELNLTNTNFTNPHGLDHELHYTTAFDLAKIAAHALQNEIFFEIAATQNLVIYPKTADGENFREGARFLRNHNRMLRMYKDAIGGKTGFTRRSGRCLVSGAERDGVRLVAVTLNASNDWNDHTEMLDYGFAHYHAISLCEEGEFTFEINVVNSDDTTILRAANISTASITVPMAVTREDIEVKVDLPQFVYAPISAGDIFGRVMFVRNDEIVAHSVIAASENVTAIAERRTVIDRIRGWFEE